MIWPKIRLRRGCASIATRPVLCHLTTLIIDDEPLARQELQYLLERAGGVEILAQGTNGIEAVELIREHKPDLVFLDVQMPGLDGFAVLKKLLDRKMAMPQVVFATAFNQYAVRAFEVNAVDYLLKPFDRKRVMQTIEKAMARLAAPVESAVSDCRSWTRCCGWWRSRRSLPKPTQAR